MLRKPCILHDFLRLTARDAYSLRSSPSPLLPLPPQFLDFSYVVDNFCRPPVIAATDGTKPFNFILVSKNNDDVDLTQRRQRIRANRKPYNAIFFWEITDDNENG